MTPTEAVAITRLVKACCPQQAFDEYTPDAYHDLLGDLRFIDARDAVRQLGRRQAFIAPSEIRTEVRRIRSARIAAHPHIDPPPEIDADNIARNQEWLADSRRRIADGETIEPPELPARAMPDLSSLLPTPED